MPKRRTSEVSSSAIKRNRILCQNCRNPILARRETSLKCTACKDWIHLRCSELTSADLQIKEKIDAVKCKLCAAMEDEECDFDGEMCAEGTSDSGSHGEALLLKQILMELKTIKKSVKSLESENADLKLSVLALTDTNNRLVRQIAVLQRSDRTRVRNDRSESRVRLAADANNRQANKRDVREKPSTRQCSSSVRSFRDDSMGGNSQGSLESRKNKKTLIKRINHRALPGPVAANLPAKPKLPSAKARIQTRKLHVSNICDSVTAEALYNHVVNNGNVHPISVKKLKARNSGARFYVEVLDVDYENLISDDLWESDTEISYYRGGLRADLVTETYPSL